MEPYAEDFSDEDCVKEHNPFHESPAGIEENGDEEAALQVDSDNPLPDFMDPITLEPVIRPAISPYGHVMGAATWKAVLAEQGLCPFTKKPLRWEQCRVLTKGNIEAYKDSIIQ